jgi:hypothetical protein
MLHDTDGVGTGGHAAHWLVTEFVGAGVSDLLVRSLLSCAYSMVTPVKGSTRRLAIWGSTQSGRRKSVDVLGNEDSIIAGEISYYRGGTVAVSLS